MSVPDITEFRKYRSFCEGAGIKDPLLIRLVKRGKEPSAQGKLKLDDKSLNPEYKLSWDEAEKAMTDGFNIGHYASPDGILHLDCDLNKGSSTIPQEIIEDLIKKADTLSTKTRSGGKHLHFLSPGELFSNPHIYWNNKDAGELRTYWQYVVVPGSFVPKEKPSKAGKTKGYTPDADGYYRLINETSLKLFDFSIFPDGLTIKEAGERKGTQVKHSQVKVGEGGGLSEDLIIQEAKRIFKDEFNLLLSGSSKPQGDDESRADYRFCFILSKFCDDSFHVASLLMKYRYRSKFDTNFKYKVQETALNAWNENDERYNPITRRLEKLNPVNAIPDDRSGIKKRDDRDKKPITHIKVYTNEPPEIQMEKVLTGLNACNCPPSLFVRSGEMVRIITDEHGYPSIEPVKEVALRTRIYDCIEFLNKNETKVRPPLDAIRDVIHGRQWVNVFPHVTGCTDTPLIHPDGKILSDPGYDKITGLYYSPSPGLIIPDIPLKPTKEDVQKAVKTIWEPFKEFTFVDKADGTHILAGLITIVCRNLITGNVPILLIDKPQAGTGASLISQIFGLISEGRDPAINSMPASEEEWKKQIISLLINGRPSVILDNIEGRLKSPALAALLTTQEYSDRLLGTNENVTYAHRIVWIGNGNNITLGGDLPRRSYWSRMDSESVRPWMDDKKYTHPDLRKWVIDNRGEILAGILTIARSWIQAGRPKPNNESVPKIGGFEQWRDVIGGILEHADIKGFLGNLQKMYDTTDTETPQWDLFTETWYNTFKEEPQTTSEVFKAITPIKTREGYTFCNHQELRDSLPDVFLDAIEREGSFTRMLGSALSKRKDRRYPSGYKIENAGEKKHAVRWKVVKIEKQSKLVSEDTK